MKIDLAGEDVIINTCFKNISKVEQSVGSMFGFAYKLRDAKVSFTDVVNIYYYMQEGGLSQEVIARKIMQDGLTKHLEQVGNIFTSILMGNSVKKPEEVQEKN